MLIVLEGLDGSGKSTQLALLRDWLISRNLLVKTIKLPDYEDDSSLLVRQYLAGRFGREPGDVNAFAASLFYAVDRYVNYRLKWSAEYTAGQMVLADRYTTSNAYHQATKLPAAEWPAFFDWLEDIEYQKLGIPRPDLVFYLDMPLEISKQLISARYQGDEQKRDIHEANFQYLEQCAAAARAACAAMGWVPIKCVNNSQNEPLRRPLQPEEIHERIRSHLSKFI